MFLEEGERISQLKAWVGNEWHYTLIYNVHSLYIARTYRHFRFSHILEGREGVYFFHCTCKFFLSTNRETWRLKSVTSEQRFIVCQCLCVPGIMFPPRNQPVDTSELVTISRQPEGEEFI